jgi:hypothetical protein
MVSDGAAISGEQKSGDHGFSVWGAELEGEGISIGGSPQHQRLQRFAADTRTASLPQKFGLPHK